MPGTVVTFYSYKGGVGRSFTLANIAVLLARWGHRVLCIDWDLEAPGLHDYFLPMMGTEPQSGVVDLVGDFVSGRARDHVTPLQGQGILHLIAAGRQDSDYVAKVQDIDWARLYERGFGDFLEQHRERWTADYDFILLDSRTGVSDIGGICTAHLPDRLVVLFTANVQSMRGAAMVAERADVARDRMPYDRPQLAVLPILSKFDSRDEYERAEQWRRTSLTETGGLFRNWLDRAVPPELMAKHLTLPYVSYWSFGEQLPVRSESTPTADQIGFALETVAAVIAHRYDRTDLLAENRDAYVAAAQVTKRVFAHDVWVSTPRSALEVADALIEELRRLGVRAERSLSGDRSLLSRPMDDARHLFLVVDGEVSRWQSAEVELFLRRTFGQDRWMFPVLTAAADPHSLPGYLRNLSYMRLGPAFGPADAARVLVNQLNGTGTGGGPDAATVLRRTATETRLRPVLWELVDDAVGALFPAVADGDQAKIRELVADIELASRPRHAYGDDYRVEAPEDIRAALERLAAKLDQHQTESGFAHE